MNTLIKVAISSAVVLVGLVIVADRTLRDVGGYVRASAEKTVDGLAGGLPREVRNKKLDNDLAQVRADLTVGVVQDADIEGLARTCNNCHGMNGVSAGPTMPSIGGLSENYLKMVMTQYRSGKRYSTVMGRLLKGYTEEEINGLAQYFSKQPWTPVAQQTDATAAKEVKCVFERCETCHGETGGEPGDDCTPKLNGQWQRYLQLELEKYRSDEIKRLNGKMTKVARKLEESDVASVSHYYAGQK